MCHLRCNETTKENGQKAEKYFDQNGIQFKEDD